MKPKQTGTECLLLKHSRRASNAPHSAEAAPPSSKISLARASQWHRQILGDIKSLMTRLAWADGSSGTHKDLLLRHMRARPGGDAISWYRMLQKVQTPVTSDGASSTGFNLLREEGFQVSICLLLDLSSP